MSHILFDASRSLPSLPAPPVTTPLPDFIGLSRSEITALLAELGVPPRQINMRTAQLWNGVYVHGARSFDAILSVDSALRSRLSSHFSLDRPQIRQRAVSTDGTRKWLMHVPANPLSGTPAIDFETVFIPETDRGTLCISSQVGCTLNCSFCHTGTQNLVRNLSVTEIVGQVLAARDEIGDWPKTPRSPDPSLPRSQRMITNVVLMGMGEPLYNFANVRDAIRIIADNEGLNFSKRRITLSTAGVVPEIPRWGRETGTMLAISLHATDDTLRDRLVNLNRKYPIATLLEACRAYPGLSNARRITFEYVMLKDINDRDRDARALIRLIAGIPAKINLIPWNPWKGAPYASSDPERVSAFAHIINKAGYASPVRTPRGRDIMAACGQLKSETRRLRAREHREAGQDRSTG